MAVRAATPEHHLGFVEFEAVILRRLKAGLTIGNAIDVIDPAAVAADHMVMVITSTTFEACGVARGLDLSNQLGIDAVGQNVVNGLLGNRSQPLMNTGVYLISRRMWVIDQPFEYSATMRGNA